MSKFKVGDRVKLIEIDIEDKVYGLSVGDIGFVTDFPIDNNLIGIEYIKAGRLCSFKSQLELAPEEFHDVPPLGSPLSDLVLRSLIEPKDPGTVRVRLEESEKELSEARESAQKLSDTETLTITFPKGTKRLEGEFGGYTVLIDKDDIL